MGLPNILIEFKSKASTAIKRGERGIVAIMLVDTAKTKKITRIDDKTQIPKTLNESEKAYVERAFLGGANPIKYVELIEADTMENALDALETVKFDYAVAQPDVKAEDVVKIAEYIKTLRDSKHIKAKAVLPNIKADHEGIINFTTDNIVVGDKTFKTAEYCSRIAGLLAGTPLRISATYQPLSEVKYVPKFTKAELDAKIDAGEFVLISDGEKIKVGRAVTSLVTTSGDKSEDLKSIKIVDTMDLIYNDIKRTCEDNYIGKYPNNYDNKCNLIVSIQAYLESLRDDELLDKDITTSIDIKSQKDYLKTIGENVDDMSEMQIKEAYTGTNVFIASKFKILNAIEDIKIEFNI